MPKRGEKLPWRLTTTWVGTDIEPFTRAFTSEYAARMARRDRMRVDNNRGDGRGTFVITNRERPDYEDLPEARCNLCHLWGTESDPRGCGMVCAEHEREIWEEMEERTAREADAGVSFS